jgi:hypothetical protein
VEVGLVPHHPLHLVDLLHKLPLQERRDTEMLAAVDSTLLPMHLVVVAEVLEKQDILVDLELLEELRDKVLVEMV